MGIQDSIPSLTTILNLIHSEKLLSEKYKIYSLPLLPVSRFSFQTHQLSSGPQCVANVSEVFL